MRFSTLMILGILGGAIGYAAYVAKKSMEDTPSKESRWDVGDHIAIYAVDYIIEEKMWKLGSYPFDVDGNIYSNQWWYRMDNGIWYPELYLVNIIR